MNDLVNVMFRQAKFSCYCDLAGASSVTLSNSPNGIFGQFGAFALSAAMNGWWLQPTLLHAISRVVERCAKEQVCRIYASAIIAAMQHVKAIQNFAVTELPRYAMRSLWPLIEPEVAVPAWVSRTSPLPTIIFASTSNHVPKALFRSVRSHFAEQF